MRYGVGIDISKGKSTVTIISDEKKEIEKTFEITHNKEGLEKLGNKLKKHNKKDIKIGYGGSINSNNIIGLKNIDILLIGSACLDINEFINIINNV